jgi:hypothetical protein
MRARHQAEQESIPIPKPIHAMIGQIGQIGLLIGRAPGTDQEGGGFNFHLFIVRGSHSDFVLSMAFVDRVSRVAIRNQD